MISAVSNRCSAKADAPRTEYKVRLLRQEKADKVYGVPVLAVPVLGMSSLALIQWIVLPPFILDLARRHMLGYTEHPRLKHLNSTAKLG
jgi:hypothetical protein